MRFQHHSPATNGPPNGTTNAIHPDGLGYRPSHQTSGSLMAPRRLITAATLLGFGLNLASCGGFVADHWPHWAGGLPADVPPRPGTPGYADFVAHGQPKPDAKPETKQEPAATAADAQSGAQQAPVAPGSAAPAPAARVRSGAPGDDGLQDSSVVNGGLY
jgi:hypothetical protein